MTRYHLSQTNLQPESIDSFAGRLAQLLASALCVGGADSSYEDMLGVLLTRYGEKLKGIVGSSLEVRRSVGEEILSSDLGTTIAAPDGAYLPGAMEDAYATGDSPEAAGLDVRVLCTTAHGLQRQERREVGKGGEMQVQTTVLLKPKVALSTLIEELELVEGAGTGTKTPVGSKIEVRCIHCTVREARLILAILSSLIPSYLNHKIQWVLELPSRMSRSRSQPLLCFDQGERVCR